jgi:hypothetical protein
MLMEFRNVRGGVEEVRGETEEEDEEDETLVDHHRLCRLFPSACERLCTPPHVFGNRSNHSTLPTSLLLISKTYPAERNRKVELVRAVDL